MTINFENPKEENVKNTYNIHIDVLDSENGFLVFGIEANTPAEALEKAIRINRLEGRPINKENCRFRDASTGKLFSIDGKEVE
jgi:hypothetical protein